MISEGSSTQLPHSVAPGDAAGGPAVRAAGPDDSDVCLPSAPVTPWAVGEEEEAQGKSSCGVDAAKVEEFEARGVECTTPEVQPDDAGRDHLKRLKGEWQSLKLGYIKVVDGDLSNSGLFVKRAGEDDQILGYIEVVHGYFPDAGSQDESDGWRVKLQLGGPVGAMSNFHISRTRSLKGRIAWVDTDNVADLAADADVWNSDLIEAIRKAGEWVARPEHGLRPDLDAGLRALARNETTESSHSVALCVATKNRLWQLRRALPLNLLHCWVHRKWTKIHLVDCDSTDGTMKWVMRKCRAAIDAGLLIVYSTEGRMPFWHASVAKNCAHIVARQDILVNVDSDNLVGLDFVVNVVDYFKSGSTVLQYEDGDGTCGRIACWRSEFHKIRGYDEDAYPMGAQDVDLVLRLKELHPYPCYQKVRHSVFSQAIKNDLHAKVANCDPKLGPGGLRWGRMDTLNRSIFQCRREAGQLERNLDKTNIGLCCRVVLP